MVPGTYVPPGASGSGRSRAGSAAGRRGGFAAGRGLLAAAGHDRHAGFVVDGSAGRAQRGAACLVVVAAQPQVNRMQAARGRGHDDRDRRPGRAAARPVGNRQRSSQPRQFIVQPGRAVIAAMPEPASHVTSITPRRYWLVAPQAPWHTCPGTASCPRNCVPSGGQPGYSGCPPWGLVVPGQRSPPGQKTGVGVPVTIEP